MESQSKSLNQQFIKLNTQSSSNNRSRSSLYNPYSRNDPYNPYLIDLTHHTQNTSQLQNELTLFKAETTMQISSLQSEITELRHLYGEAILLINIIARIQTSNDSIRSSKTECQMEASHHVVNEQPEEEKILTPQSSCEIGTITPLDSNRSVYSSCIADGNLQLINESLVSQQQKMQQKAAECRIIYQDGIFQKKPVYSQYSSNSCNQSSSQISKREVKITSFNQFDAHRQAFAKNKYPPAPAQFRSNVIRITSNSRESSQPIESNRHKNCCKSQKQKVFQNPRSLLCNGSNRTLSSRNSDRYCSNETEFRSKVGMLEDQDTVLEVLIEYHGQYLLPDFFCPELPREVQRNLINKICSACSKPLNQFAINKEWLDHWDQYVAFQNPTRPLSITNEQIYRTNLSYRSIIDEETQKMRLDSNFAIINNDTWIFLVAWYGTDFEVQIDPVNFSH